MASIIRQSSGNLIVQLTSFLPDERHSVWQVTE